MIRIVFLPRVRRGRVRACARMDRPRRYGERAARKRNGVLQPMMRVPADTAKACPTRARAPRWQTRLQVRPRSFGEEDEREDPGGGVIARALRSIQGSIAGARRRYISARCQVDTLWTPRWIYPREHSRIPRVPDSGSGLAPCSQRPNPRSESIPRRADLGERKSTSAAKHKLVRAAEVAPPGTA